MKFRALSLSLMSFFVMAGCAQMPDRAAGLQSQPQLVLAASGKPLQTEQLRCQGTGSPECEKNWQMLEVGHSTSDAEYWLGSDHESLQRIYIDRVENTWQFQSGGRLIFNNGLLAMIEPPATYLFPANEAESQLL